MGKGPQQPLAAPLGAAHLPNLCSSLKGQFQLQPGGFADSTSVCNWAGEWKKSSGQLTVA